MFLIVGLGNPGRQYQATRHNVGFMAVDFLSDRYNFSWSNKSKFNSDIAEGNALGNKIILCKPTTYMNLIGQAVQPIVSYYKITAPKIIVIHDDMDLAFGKIRCKIGGGSGGHNGIKSIDQMLGTNEYLRIKIGVGRPQNDNEHPSDFLLQNFFSDEQIIIDNKLATLADNMELLLQGKMDEFKAKIAL
jgi:PTH1 family peptidyl-tRNA hydrolase